MLYRNRLQYKALLIIEAIEEGCTQKVVSELYAEMLKDPLYYSRAYGHNPKYNNSLLQVHESITNRWKSETVIKRIKSKAWIIYEQWREDQQLTKINRKG